MSRQDNDELAASERSLNLSQSESSRFSIFVYISLRTSVARSLHEIAEQLGQVGTLVIRADPQDDRHYPGGGTGYVCFLSFCSILHNFRSHFRSVVSSRRLSYVSDREKPPDGRRHHRPNDLESTSQNHHFNDTDRHNPLPTQHPLENRSSVTARFSRNNTGYTGPSLQARVTPHSRMDQSVLGNDIRSDLSPPPSPTFGILVQPVPDPQARAIHHTDHQTPRSVGQPPLPPQADDVYTLDECLVNCHTSSKRLIHRPPIGKQGSQGRWYYVTRGTKVGIFNEWYVWFHTSAFVLSNDYRREVVQNVTSGVSGAHQQRARTETLAYTHFKRALLEGRVEIIE